LKLLIIVLTLVVQFILEPSAAILVVHSFKPIVDGILIVAQESFYPIIPWSSVVHQHVVIASAFIFITLIASVVG